MASSRPRSSMVEQVEQMERAEQIPAVPVGGTGGLYRVPVPPRPRHVIIGKKPVPAKPTFALTLEAVPSWGGVPVIIRLRRFLKMALRSYGMRCLECRETPAQPQATGRTEHRPGAGGEEPEPRQGQSAARKRRRSPSALEAQSGPGRLDVSTIDPTSTRDREGQN
jgi:hypothetical protein